MQRRTGATEGGARGILRRVFGYPTFRPHQEEIIKDLLDGHDVFVLMPTGGGKSLCYQVPAILRAGTAIVVSPLISLMKDQVDALLANGVAAACYNSSMDADSARRTLAKLHAGELDLLYVSPERVMSGGFMNRLAGLDVALFAIDEAHCVSQWGHDFRPEYAALSVLRDRFPGTPIAALTATADPQTRADILTVLGLEDARVHVTGFDRPNIRYRVSEKSRPFEQLMRFLAERRDDAGIVYALSRKKVESVTERLRAEGVVAAAYHAGLDSTTRSSVQERFLRDELRVVVATVAFGMGIDKPNVRFVVHYDMPRHIEGYYQETGRAGRDGLPAEALLLFGAQDIVTARSLIDNGSNADQVRIESHKLNAMVGFAESLGCRRRVLLGYFGEPLDDDCGNCDTCLDPPERFDATEDARKALSCIYRVGQRFGMKHVIDVLRGADSGRIRTLGHHRLSTYGIGADKSAAEWSSVLRQLIHHGLVEQDIANYSVLRLTAAARPVLRGEAKIILGRPRKGVRHGRASNDDRLSLTPREQSLYEALRATRTQIAKANSVPPYVVFSDATLWQMARERPLDDGSLLAISGVGNHKLEKYGAAFLATIRESSKHGAH